MRSLSRDSRILQRQLPACTVSSAWDRRFGRYQRRTASNSDGNGSFRCKTKISVELVFTYCRTVVFYLRDGVCRSVDRACYSHEGGYAFIGVSLRVCFLFLYQQDYPKIFNRFSRNSVKKVARGPRKKSSDFRGNLGPVTVTERLRCGTDVTPREVFLTVTILRHQRLWRSNALY